MPAATMLQRAAQGASLLVLSKVFTFILQMQLLRGVRSSALGFSKVTLDLLKATVLALSREAPRAVALRLQLGGGARGAAAQRFTNLAWLSVPAGLALALLCALAPAALGAQLNGRQALAWALMCGAAAVEALAEPAYIFATATLRFERRAGAEAAAQALRCGVAYALHVRGGEAWGGEAALACGELAAAGAYFLWLWGAAAWHGGSEWAPPLLPHWLPAGGGGGGGGSALARQVGPTQAALVAAFLPQTLFMHVLTQADKLVLQVFASEEQRGDYATAEQLGGLVPRLLLQPVEEALRGVVSQLLPTGAATRAPLPASPVRSRSSAKARTPARNGPRSPPPPPPPPGGAPILVAARVLSAVLHAVMLLGALVAGFGSAFAPLALRLLMKEKAGGGVPPLLSAFCVYVLFLALNGVTEAFASAAADGARLRAATVQLALGAAAAAAAVLAVRVGLGHWLGATAAAAELHRWGPLALVALNCGNMALRAASSLAYAARRVAEAGGAPRALLAAALPRGVTLALLGALVAAAHAEAKQHKIENMLRHAAGGGARELGAAVAPSAAELGAAAALGAAALAVIAVFEWPRLRETRLLLKTA